MYFYLAAKNVLSYNCMVLPSLSSMLSVVDTWFSFSNLNISPIIFNKVLNHKRKVGIDLGGYGLNCFRIRAIKETKLSTSWNLVKAYGCL